MDRKEIAIASLVAGYADTATFLDVEGLFSAHVTGNFVLFAAQIARGGSGDLLKLIAFPVFVGTVASSTFLHGRVLGADERKSRLALLSLSTLLLFLVGLAHAGARALGTPLSETQVAFAAMVVVVSMGALNAVQKLVPDGAPATTVMTGNVTQLTIEFTRMVFSPTADPKAAHTRSRLMSAVGGFLAGCCAAALAVPAFGLSSLVFPAALLGVCAFRSREPQGNPGPRPR